MRVALVFLLALRTLAAESNLVECIADAWYSVGGRIEGSGKELETDPAGGAILLAFRTGAIERWKVEKAVIVLHLVAPSQPVEVTISLTSAPWRESSQEPPPLRHSVTTEEKAKPDEWISIAIPAEMAQELADGKATGIAVSAIKSKQIFHSRETIQFSPFLAVIGKRPLQ